jgi:3-deoxy-D-manno-octulosonic-acid transferase
MFLIYQIFLALAVILLSPILFYKGVFSSQGFGERFGRWNYQSSPGKVVWFHAASMGELKAIAAIIPLLRQQYADIKPVITTITKTGWNKAKSLELGADVFFAPLDLSFTVKSSIRQIKPSVLVLVETEIWPILIKSVKNAGIPIVIANARLSRKSTSNYKYVRPFLKAILSKIDFIMAQSEEDAQRFIDLGAPPERVAIYGNIKFDQIANSANGQLAEELSAYFSHADDFVFIAGSVREKEIAPVIEAISDISKKQNNFKAVIALRHLKNIELLENSLRQAGLSYFKRSELNDSGKISDYPNIMLLDTMGELGSLYSKANLSFVGGSLVPIGGHDPLEPASAGNAVCFGPHMENSRLASKQLLESGGAKKIGGSKQLAALINSLIQNRQSAKSMGDKARQLVLRQSGVSKRIVTKLTEYL